MGDEQLFGKYRLVRRLAFGGMAEIFLARLIGDEGFQKNVVLKRILPQFSSDPEFTRMFIDEAVLAARITHPNVAQVYDFGQVDGTYFITMEHVDGTDLRKLVRNAADRNRVLTPVETAAIGEAMARGLAYVHDLTTDDGMPLTIVHRDISPHNVMLSRTGDLKIMDFGIAKAAARATNTATGMVKGKLAYMAPEQANGKDVDKRTDQFAVGLVLWECLAGKRLFEGDSEPELLSRVAAGRVRSLREASPDVPEALEQIVMRSLKIDPDERYPDLHAMEQELAAFRFSLGTAGAVRLASLVDELVPREPSRPIASQQVSGTKPLDLARESGTRSLGVDGTAQLPEPLHTSGAVAKSSPSEWSVSERRTEATRLAEGEPGIEATRQSGLRRAAVAADATAVVAARGGKSRVALWGGAGVVALAAVIAVAVRLATPASNARLTLASDPPDAKIFVRGEDGALMDIGLVTPGTFEPGPVGSSVRWHLEAPGYQPADGETTLRRDKELAKIKLEPLPVEPPPAPEPPVVTAPEPAAPEPAPVAEKPSKASVTRDAASQSPYAKANKQGHGETGEVVLTMRGWANVFENGKQVGLTGSPITMPAGRHSLDLRLPNGSHQRVTVVVEPNKRIQRKVETK